MSSCKNIHPHSLSLPDHSHDHHCRDHHHHCRDHHHHCRDHHDHCRDHHHHSHDHHHHCRDHHHHDHHCRDHHCVPDLHFDYDVNTKYSKYSKIAFGTSILETISGDLFQKEKKIIKKYGKFAISNTIYDVEDKKSKTFFEDSSVVTFYLSNGSIQFLTADKFTKDKEGNFILPSGKSVYKIVSGTDMYLKAKGYVEIEANNNFRKVKIYFTNKK